MAAGQTTPSMETGNETLRAEVEDEAGHPVVPSTGWKTPSEKLAETLQ
jgi:hypothetical protein